MEMTSRTWRVVARIGIWLLRPGSACSGPGSVRYGRRIAGSARDSVGSAGAPLPPRRIQPRGAGRRLLGGPPRPFRPRAGAFAAGIVRSASRPATSAAALPARVPRCSRRWRRRRRRNSSAGFRNRNAGSGARPLRSALDPSAPALDSPSRELIRCLPNSIRRLRRRIRRLPRSIRHLATPTRSAPPETAARDPRCST